MTSAIATPIRDDDLETLERVAESLRAFEAAATAREVTRVANLPLGLAVILAIVCVALACVPARRAHAQSPARQAVAAHVLARGQVLTIADIDSAMAPVRAARDTSRVGPGWVARRVVAAGEPLVPPAVAPPPAIATGDSVRVEWNAGGIAIALRGVAMNTAPQGGRVGVRVAGRGRFEGTVVAPALVRID